jgi:hypothetical protein
MYMVAAKVPQYISVVGYPPFNREQNIIINFLPVL